MGDNTAACLIEEDLFTDKNALWSEPIDPILSLVTVQTSDIFEIKEQKYQIHFFPNSFGSCEIPPQTFEYPSKFPPKLYEFSRQKIPLNHFQEEILEFPPITQLAKTQSFPEIRFSLPSPPQLTSYTELSAEYKERIVLMDNVVTKDNLEQVIDRLRVIPLLRVAEVLGRVLQDKEQRPDSTMEGQVKRLLELYKTLLDENTLMGQLFKPASSEGEIQVFDPKKDTAATINLMLLSGRTCNAVYGPNLTGTSPERLAMDAKAGGSVHYTNRISTNASYNRLYLAVDKEGTPLAFYDTIELGNGGRTRIKNYVEANLEQLLLQSFATSIVLTKRLGLPRIAFGDTEVAEIAKLLGTSERKIFNNEEERGNEKLGYIAGANNGGPYLWMMARDKSFHTMEMNLFDEGIIPEIAGQVQQVMGRARAHPKSLRSCKEAYTHYFTAVDLMLRDTKDYDGLRKNLSTFYQEFNLSVPDAVAEYRRVPHSGEKESYCGYTSAEIIKLASKINWPQNHQKFV